MGNKKIYAEYHNPRYTRDKNEGNIKNWKYTGVSKDSKAKIKRYNYNADLIDSSGRHNLAAVNYPIIGMQAQNDPHYCEYQILLAKMAKIDGFMIDFRHTHDKDGIEQVEVLQKEAAKYGFEIGVDWCDAQIFYHLQKYRPDLDTREKQIEYCSEIFDYLYEKVYSVPTAAVFDSHPVILLFGDGFSFSEYKYLKYKDHPTKNMNEPWFFRRAMMNCSLEENEVKYTYDEDHPYFTDESKKHIAGAFGWVPFRIRDAVSNGYDYWDVYATPADCINYLDTLRKYVNKNRNVFGAHISIVTPGMDQRGCAAWGRAISYLERGNGDLYKTMWEYNIFYKAETEMIFIASWNDYNEGHEIEPTIENGYRELRLTSQYACMFKDIENTAKDEYFKMPKDIFDYRKKAEFYNNIGIDAKNFDLLLDSAALAVSKENYAAVIEILDKCSLIVLENDKSITAETYAVGFEPALFNEQTYIKMEEAMARNLRSVYFDGYLNFEYFDDDFSTFEVISSTNKYKIVCQITKDDTKTWKSAKVKLYKCNTALNHDLDLKSDFIFKDGTKVRNIFAEITTYKIN